MTFPTLEGAPSKLCLGGDFDVHPSQTRSYLRKYILSPCLVGLKHFHQARQLLHYQLIQKGAWPWLRVDPNSRGRQSFLLHYLSGEAKRWRSNRSGSSGSAIRWSLPTVKLCSPAENPRPSRAWTGHPSDGATPARLLSDHLFSTRVEFLFPR
jgi:hypothetical protein